MNRLNVQDNNDDVKLTWQNRRWS